MNNTSVMDWKKYIKQSYVYFSLSPVLPIGLTTLQKP